VETEGLDDGLELSLGWDEIDGLDEGFVLTDGWAETDGLKLGMLDAVGKLEIDGSIEGTLEVDGVTEGKFVAPPTKKVTVAMSQKGLPRESQTSYRQLSIPTKLAFGT